MGRRVLIGLVASMAVGSIVLGATGQPEKPAAGGAADAAATGSGLDAAHRAKARAMMDKAVAYLRSTQDGASGGWNVPPADGKKPHLPAITGLVVNGMLLDPAVARDDAAVMSGAKYLLNFQQADGGIYDRVMPSYNTSISLSALAKVNTPQAKAAIKPAQDFLRRLQYSEDSDPAVGGPEASKPVTRTNPYYGGIGYGGGGRPDMSNLGFMLQALHDSGVAAEDKAFQRALVFLERCQMSGDVNDQEYAKGSTQGGFIYSTSENKDKVGSGESKAAVIEETMDDGTKVSRLRAYGSITYVGFKSYLYANLARNDKRVVEALGWIKDNYTLAENPGVGMEGMYYYFVMFSRALSAWGEEAIVASAPKGDGGGSAEPRNWRHDLIDRLAELQNEDGSFKSVNNRWMEGDPVLITAYALTALGAAAE
ncbi:MAG: hypothetical protein KF745_07150 [Phycisphaeraceae bacterium]|nr:hypothetical protein [Phycisphaeraceae bacterium]